MAGRGPRMTEFEGRDYYPDPPRPGPEFEEVDRRRTITRSPPPRFREERTPAFLREDVRRNEPGPMVLRQREVETFDRRRSPSPSRVREERPLRRPRSVSPPPRPMPSEEELERSHTRIVERDRIRSPSVERRRSPSPRPVRYVDRPRRSPSPQRVHTRIVDRQRERSSSSSSSSSASEPPRHMRGPTIERDVITHYRDIDHGMVRAKRPSPPPAPRPRSRTHERERDWEADIDISMTKNSTEVDIHRSDSHARSRSRDRGPRYRGDELVVRGDSRRRAHSAAPDYPPIDEEGRYITKRIDSRGYPGEAWHGATKRWEIVDVPPGTERVRMDGVGGGSTDTSWSKYSGVRRTKWIPERDGPAPAIPRDRERDRTNATAWDREMEVDIDKTVERRWPRQPPPQPGPPPKEMWTEISKDLLVREAVEQMGYEFEETPMFFYIMKYLRYEEVLQLVDLSDEIRRYRRDRAREIEWERGWRDDGRRRHHHHRPRPWDDERVKEREVIYDSRRPYYR